MTGTVPKSLSQLIALTTLDLGDNWFKETIPTELSKLTLLNDLYMDQNEFTGTIPSEVGELSRLTRLELHNNSLSGTIPSELFRLTALSLLQLNNNGLTGTVPTQLSKLTDLVDLFLHQNELTGTVPSISNSVDPSYCELNNNKFDNIENARAAGCKWFGQSPFSDEPLAARITFDDDTKGYNGEYHTSTNIRDGKFVAYLNGETTGKYVDSEGTQPVPVWVDSFMIYYCNDLNAWGIIGTESRNDILNGGECLAWERTGQCNSEWWSCNWLSAPTISFP